ncbi:hypothetical protein Tco_0625574 [Tanacetum coccineum]|uniref:Reverse transcriptase Ty1/copia-type domain-containing protein n=1 Tax=Tanacetum coccineum TaxID=301880 RepID=A0ABQ4WH92_9ASTR
MSSRIYAIAVSFMGILNVNKSCVDECNKCLELETRLLKKKDLIEKDVYDKLLKTLKNKLRKLKGKNAIDTAVSKPSATIAPGMFKLDIEPISHRLKNNRDAHELYLGHPSLTKPEKIVDVTPMNKDKKVRFAEPVTSLSNIPNQTDSFRTKDSNKPLLTSTGVNTTTSASGSKPSGNTKKNRISRPPSSNQKNKVEENLRKVKSSFNKMNYVSEPISNVPLNPVSTRHQRKDESRYSVISIASFLAFIEPRSYKEALTKSCWIKAMHEELNEFERLEVRELEEGIEFEQSFALVARLEAIRIFIAFRKKYDNMNMIVSQIDVKIYAAASLPRRQIPTMKPLSPIRP